MSDWHDPFAKDEEDLERERRRAEREARRRERQGSLAEKVQAEQAAAQVEPTTAAARRQAGLEPEPPTAPPPAVAPPPTAAAPSAPPAPPPRPPRARPSGPDALLIRRIVGALIIVAVAALLVFGATKVIGALGDGGSDDPAPAPVGEVKTSDLTIPEGLDRHQIADVANEAKLKGDYEEASKSFKGFDPAEYGAEDAANLEGFLFPATYELPKKATVKDLISRQLDAFEQNMNEVDLSYAESKNLNAYDVLKIASMIEREVQVEEERPLVAEVIYNRLKEGTPLGIDATIRYYLQNYDEQLTESELADTTNPYNTRVLNGLPPTPIGNPGLASIEAAANPAKGDLFYFVVKPGTCGEHVFTETEEEFLQAEAEYQQALAEQGGSPTEC